MSETYKRKRGDRRDARWVKDVSGLTTLMMHIMPTRTAAEVYLSEKLDVTDLMAYLQEENARHPDYKTTIFHAIIVLAARILRERPKMNRFVQGRRMYERYEVSLSFMAKRRFADNAEEAFMFFVPKDEDTLSTVSYEIAGKVHEARKSEHSDGGFDSTVDAFAKVPRLLLMAIVRVVRWLDFWGVNPKALTEGDSNYSSVLLSNLGSIRGPSVYHHLNDYGSNSIMVTVGTVHKEKLAMPDGSEQLRDVLEIGVTMDERIGDGFYFVRSLRLFRYACAHPELLARPLGEPSGFDYESKEF